MSPLDLAALGSVTIALFGLAIGSFLNVVAYRVPLGLSVVSPPSACPGCGAPIEARDNIPLLSWILLRGKCRHCAEPISARYIVVETITGVAFVGVALLFLPGILAAASGPSLVSRVLVLVAFLYLAAVSVALTAIDIDVRRLPDRIVLPSYGVGVVLLGAAAIVGGDFTSFLRALAGAAILFVFYFLLALIKPGGMGMGDVKLAGVLGLFLGQLGWAELAVGAAGAFLLGGIFGVVLMIGGRAKRRSAIPFGPWMFAGAWLGIFAGAPIANSYLTLVGLT
ncbi:MAG: Peptidase [Rhodoglobus sp.]|nr:Peptidase [Rhodoglobus sp.]